MGASQGAELERVTGAVPGLLRLWRNVEKSKSHTQTRRMGMMPRVKKFFADKGALGTSKESLQAGPNPRMRFRFDAPQA
jgi:hypothetical protein